MASWKDWLAKGCHVIACLYDRRVRTNKLRAAIFSFYLTPKAIGNAEMTLGGIDHSKFKGNLVYAQLSNDSSAQDQWQLSSTQISVNGKTSSTLKASRTFVVDTGTSNIVMDPQAAKVLIYCLECQSFSSFVSHRTSTQSSRLISSPKKTCQEPSEFRVIRYPLWLPISTSHSRPSKENPSTWLFPVRNLVSAPSQTIHLHAKL